MAHKNPNPKDSKQPESIIDKQKLDDYLTKRQASRRSLHLVLILLIVIVALILLIVAISQRI